MPANKVLFLHSFAKINIKKENKVYFSFKNVHICHKRLFSTNFNTIRSAFKTYLCTYNKSKDSYTLCHYLFKY